MENNEIIAILEKTGALRSGHFRLTSGRHSDAYIQCARVQEQPALNNRLAKAALENLPEDIEFDSIVAPAVGGIVFGYAVASIAEKRFIWTERVEGTMTLRRGFAVLPGEKFLVSEDVVTTGGSVKEVIDLIEAAGGEIVGVVSMIYRGGEILFNAPFYPLIELATPSWDVSECALCNKGVEIDAPGSRNIAIK